ncbi:hypothetical protein CEUSTIGMA_g10508.t1 [Chlamydomonas eustigma]|uniref:sn-1-specific diacylglycerol lipase n=1 Tax=Chlamydomonas eustigma TaxID=1157962 RepID=A0A250XJI9_9CHLO|nr:hypothetical protein CEUSTIGMA_g10508.t1 [Chlamydomonas eustigma]|eukprot:GAX83082.1 hypothetical protein CEUSTIGMA_g10508.t1 [Chlamydomonas eustigma]
MPALKVFGRRWHIASDDLPPFLSFGIAFHLVWSAFLATALALEPGTCSDAGSTNWLRAFLATLLGIDALETLGLSILTYVGLQGSLLDHKTERASVPKLLYLVTSLYVLLLGITIYGTLVLTYFSSCVYSGGGPWDLVAFARAAVALHWVAVGAFFVTTFVTFNPFPDHADVATWQARCECMCCWVSEPEGSLLHQRQSVGRKPSVAMQEVDDVTASAYHPAPQGCSSDEEASHTVIHIAFPTSTRHDLPEGLDSHAEAQALASMRTAPAGALEPPASYTSRLASMLHGMFSHVDLTVSDWASCLLLVGILHRLHIKKASDPPLECDFTFTAQTQQQQVKTQLGVLQGCCGCASAEVFGEAHASSPDTNEGASQVHWYNGLEVAASDAVSAGIAATNEGARVPFDMERSAQNSGSAGRCGVGDGVDLQVLKDADHYFKHACAVYGWPMHMWMHLAKPRCCSVCTGCCTCCTPLRNHPMLQGASYNVTKNMSIEAIQQATGINIETDLLYCSHDDIVEGIVPTYIALDRERHEVILAVRGSMSVTDVVTDLMCFPDKVEPSWYQPPNPKGTGTAAVGAASSAVNHGMNKEPSLKTPIMSPPPAVHEATAAPSEEIMGRPNSARQASSMASRNSPGMGLPLCGPTSCSDVLSMDEPPHIYAHQGILRSARAVLASIERSGVLRAVLEGDEKEQNRLGHNLYRQDCRLWRLVVVGHSLGAGVAALLAMHLRLRYPNLHCWSFAPPGGLLSPQACLDMKPYCTSVIIGRDMIPRLSLRSVERLADEMLVAAARCKVSKSRLWLSTTLFGTKWQEEQLFKKEEEVHEEARMMVERLRLGMNLSISAQGLSKAREFLSPGRLLYLELFKKPSKDKKRKQKERLFIPRWMGNEELAAEGLVVGTRMFQTHFPDVQAEIMSSVLREALNETEQPAVVT